MGIEGAVSMDQSLIDAVNSLSQLTAVQWVQLVMLVVIAGLLWTTIRQMGVVSNVLDVMKSQQKSSDKHEDKLAAAIERFPVEMNKAGQALLLINRGVDTVRSQLDDTQTHILARLEELNKVAAGETSDIKDGMGQVYDLIEEKFQIVVDDVAILKQAMSKNPQIPPEVQSVLDRVLGYLETARPKLGTGTFRAVVQPLTEVTENKNGE